MRDTYVRFLLISFLPPILFLPLDSRNFIICVFFDWPINQYQESMHNKLQTLCPLQLKQSRLNFIENTTKISSFFHKPLQEQELNSAPRAVAANSYMWIEILEVVRRRSNISGYSYIKLILSPPYYYTLITFLSSKLAYV